MNIDLTKKMRGSEFLIFLHFAEWKLRKFIHTLFWQKFREINDVTTEITK